MKLLCTVYCVHCVGAELAIAWRRWLFDPDSSLSPIARITLGVNRKGSNDARLVSTGCVVQRQEAHGRLKRGSRLHCKMHWIVGDAPIVVLWSDDHLHTVY